MHDASGANSEHRGVNVLTNKCYTLTLSFSHTHTQSTALLFTVHCIEIDYKVTVRWNIKCVFVFINSYYRNNIQLKLYTFT